MSLEYNKELIAEARKERSNMSKSQKRLWYDFLAKYIPRFQRKKVIGDYIVDFFCHQAKLVVEVDKTKLDTYRHQTLTNMYGLRVLYVDSFNITRNFSYVCRDIELMIEDAKPSSQRRETP